MTEPQVEGVDVAAELEASMKIVIDSFHLGRDAERRDCIAYLERIAFMSPDYAVEAALRRIVQVLRVGGHEGSAV